MRLFLGVNRRRYGVAPGDLAGLDGIRRNRRRFFQIKSRGPRMFKVGSVVRLVPPNPRLGFAERRRRRRGGEEPVLTTLPISPIEQPKFWARL